MSDTSVDAPALHDPATYQRGVPYEYYRWLRDNDPVSHHDHPNCADGYWAVTRHADVQRGLPRRRHVPQRAGPVPRRRPPTPGAAAGSTELLISLDAPDHIKMRKLVNKGFTPRRVADLADRLRAAHRRHHRRPRRPRRPRDLVHDLALWLPLHVIADMVGVPEEDRAAGLRLDRAHLRLRPRRSPPRTAQPGDDGHVHVRRRPVRRAAGRTRRTTS